MQFFANRKYRKDVQGWFRFFAGVGQGQIADALWARSSGLAEDAITLRRAGHPAIMAAAELMRRVLVAQLRRTTEVERDAILAYLTRSVPDYAPSPLASLALGYCNAMDNRPTLGEIDAGMAKLMVSDVMFAVQGIAPEKASRIRIERALEELLVPEDLRRGAPPKT